MKDEIIKIIKSRPGYRFSEGKLDAALARGIKDGDVIMANGQMTVRIEGGFAIARTNDGTQVGPSMDLSVAKNANDCLKMYAIHAAQAI